MKKDLKAIANKSEKELRELLKSKKEDLFKLMLDNKQNKLKNTRVIFNTRKEIARILTLIRERELAITEDTKESTEAQRKSSVGSVGKSAPSVIAGRGAK